MLEKAIQYYQKAYQTFHQPEDLEKLTELIGKKTERSNGSKSLPVAINGTENNGNGQHIGLKMPLSPRRDKIKLDENKQNWRFRTFQEFVALVEDSLGHALIEI